MNLEYDISDKERNEVIKNCMKENGALKNYPVKEKKKIIVLQEIAKNFSKEKIYSEKEVNEILQNIYEDYATIRRALVDYNFVERTKNCSSYWVPKN